MDENKITELERMMARNLEKSDSIRDDVKDIKRSIEKLEAKVDKTSDQTIRNDEQLKAVKREQDNFRQEYETDKEKIWSYMSDKKEEIKKDAKKDIQLWVYGAIVISVGSLCTSFIIYYLTKGN